MSIYWTYEPGVGLVKHETIPSNERYFVQQDGYVYSTTKAKVILESDNRLCIHGTVRALLLGELIHV